MEPARYSFANCVLDLERVELRRHGQAVALRRKSFELLVYLIERRERVVSKDELLDAIWSGRDVGEAAITSSMKALRRAAGDDGRAQNIIATVRGFGYRFVAPLDVVAAAGGQPRPEAASPDAGERGQPGKEYKQVSVFCARLRGLDGLASRHSDEANDRLMERFTALARAHVERFGGAIVQRMGDGCMAVFGAPQALEDHVRRAVIAATELTAALTGPDAPPLGARVATGVHTGPIVVASLANGVADVYTASCATTRWAEALERHAPDDGVLLSEAVHCNVANEIAAEPVALGDGFHTTAYLLDRVVERRAGVPGTSRGGPYVGRTEELALVRQRAALVQEQLGQAINISGEPGIGKSRFLYEVKRRLQRPALRFIHTRCLSYGMDTPYLPVRRALQRLARIDETLPHDEQTRRLRSALAGCGLDEPPAVSLLMEILGDLGNEDDTLAELAPELRRRKTFAYMHELFVRTARARPIALLVDDLQWADATSLAWLNELVGRLQDVPLLLLTASRFGFASPWSERQITTQINLPPLSREASLALMQSLVMAPASREGLDAAQLRKAGGNPFFIEELTRAASLSDTPAANDDALPQSVQSVLSARIDSLPGGCKQLLQVAAVIGTEVPYSLLRAVSPLSAYEFESTLDALHEVQMLYTAQALPTRVLAVKHALITEVAYQSMVSDDRRRIHESVARAMLAGAGGTAEAESIALHFSEAGLAEEASVHWGRAGHMAMQRSAVTEAVSHLSRGIALAATLHPSAAVRERELDMQLALGAALVWKDGVAASSAERAFTRARDLAEGLGQTRPLFSAMMGLSRLYYARGDHRASRTLGLQLLEVAQADGADALLQSALQVLGVNRLYMGEFPQALACFDRALSSADAELDRALANRYGISPRVQCLAFASHCLWFTGHTGAALARADEALRVALELGHAHSLALALYFACRLSLLCECTARAEPLLRELEALSREKSFPLWRAIHLFLVGWLQATREPGQGLERMSAALAEVESLGAHIFRQSLQLNLAEMCLLAGRPEPAGAALEECRRIVADSGQNYLEAELFRLEGMLRLGAAQDRAGAIESFESALAVARAQAAPMLELRAAVALAPLWADSGRRADARAMLACVLGRLPDAEPSAERMRAETILAAM